MSDLTINCPDNPYNPKARLVRQAIREQRQFEQKVAFATNTIRLRNRRNRKPAHLPEVDKVRVAQLHPSDQYDARVTVSDELATDIAQRTGVRISDTPRHQKEYVVAVPLPKLYPYHPLENPHGTRVPFEEAVANYDSCAEGRRKRNKNRRSENRHSQQ